MSGYMVFFPQGLVGCESWRRFVLVDVPDEPVQQLVCLDEPGVAFLTTRPQLVVPGYRLTLSDADEQVLGCRDQAELQVLCTLTLNAQPPMVTANLLGPLVINPATGVAKQVVLVDSGYSTKHPVVQRLGESAHARPGVEELELCSS